jgi:CheY-like chemotaxis protein
MAGAARRQTRRESAAGLLDRIAAEVREPVHGALAVTEQLRRMRLPDGADAYLDTIAEASAGILALLETASDLQGAELGRLTLSPEPRRLQEVMDEVEGRWRSRADNAGVTLLVSYDGDPDCAAMVDSARLMQVFDALIGHALAHVRHGVVEASLKTRAVEGGVSVGGRVRDNSASFAAEDLDSLFDLSASNAETGGMTVKLGLALAGRTVAALGGKLSAEANVGPGATIAFDALLPAAGAEAPEEAPALTEAARCAHILVVDDNATNRMVVEALCEMFDCSTESVVDGVEAVEAARAGRFDVILMDIKMPRMDGVTATREIRKLPGEAGRTPIIALTANADPDEVAQYIAAGMRAVVEKPIKPERLMEALNAALSGGDEAASPGANAAAA